MGGWHRFSHCLTVCDAVQAAYRGHRLAVGNYSAKTWGRGAMGSESGDIGTAGANQAE